MLGDSKKVDLRAIGAPEEESSIVQAQVGSVPGVLEHGGRKGKFKMQYGPRHMGRGRHRSQRPGAIPGGATHCCSAHMTSQWEVPERGWQFHENGTALPASVSPGLQETLRDHWADGQTALSHHPHHSDPQIGQNPLCFGLLQSGAHEAPCRCGMLWATHLHPPSSVTLIPTEPLALRPLPKISVWLAQFQHSSSGKSALGTWHLAALCSQGHSGFFSLMVCGSLDCLAGLITICPSQISELRGVGVLVCMFTTSVSQSWSVRKCFQVKGGGRVGKAGHGSRLSAHELQHPTLWPALYFLPFAIG